MAAPVFVGTDFPVYSRDMRDAEKHAGAREWLQVLWDNRRVRVSPRVLVNEASVRASRPRQSAGGGRHRVWRRPGHLPGAIQTPWKRREGGYMRKNLLLSALGAGLVAMVGAVPASAMATRVNAHIPFAFVVENTNLPAGDYTIEPLGIDTPSVLLIRSADDKVSVEFLTNAVTPEKPPSSAELVFDRYGKKEFLKQVLVPGDQSAAIAISASERRAEKTAMKAAERHVLAVEHHPLKGGTTKH
jgi:hypothetical protein